MWDEGNIEWGTRRETRFLTTSSPTSAQLYNSRVSSAWCLHCVSARGRTLLTIVTSKYQLSLDLASDSNVSFLATERGCRALLVGVIAPPPDRLSKLEYASTRRFPVSKMLTSDCISALSARKRVIRCWRRLPIEVQRSVQGSCENPHDFRWVLVFLVRLGRSACVV